MLRGERVITTGDWCSIPLGNLGGGEEHPRLTPSKGQGSSESFCPPTLADMAWAAPKGISLPAL